MTENLKSTEAKFCKERFNGIDCHKVETKTQNIGKEIREKSSDYRIDRHRVPEFKANSIYLVNGINEKINKDFYPNSPIVIYGEMGVIGVELYTKEPSKPDKAVLEIAKTFYWFQLTKFLMKSQIPIGIPIKTDPIGRSDADPIDSADYGHNPPKTSNSCPLVG